MRKQFIHSISPFLLSAGISPCAIAEGTVTPQASEKGNPEVRLCDALEAVGYGERFPITVSGVYKSGFELSILFDPKERRCRLDVQPSTWVEFAPSARSEDPTLFDDLRGPTEESTHAAIVTFEGELWGPGDLGDDDRSTPAMISYANRVAGQRYGHMNGFRTKLVVRSIISVDPARSSEIETGEMHRPERAEDFPTILEGKIPVYPTRAQTAGITGRIVVHVRVEAGNIKQTTLLSGDRLLATEALTNIGTWRFSSDVSTSFITTYIYQLELRPANQPKNPKVILELPERATIIGSSNGW